ncbi:MAG: MFS transporter [Actinophytocola sp.]|nr:MFS transporter [Actinophytocola sp.]
MPAGTSGGRFPSIRLLQLTAFVSTLDRFAMPPMLLAIAHDLGVPLSEIVQAAGAYFLAYGLMQPVWGMISDSLGLVRTMRLSLLLAAISTTAAAFAWTPLALGLARGLAGGCFGAAYPAGLIYLGDTVPAQRRQREITRLLVGVAVGTALASLGAGLVAQFIHWRAAFVMTGLASLALTFVLRHLVEPPRVRQHRTVLSPIVQVVRSRAAVFVLLLAFTEGAVLLGVLTLLPSAVEDTGTTAAIAGGVTGIYGLAVYASAHVVGRLSVRLHPSRLIALGATAALAACVILSFSRSPAVTVVVAVLLGLAWAAMHSSLQTWATEVMPGARATVVSLFAGALFVGSAVAAIAVAGLAEAGRYGEIFVLAGATTIPLGLLAAWGRARWRRPVSHP